MTQPITPVFIVGAVALIVALFFFIVTFTEHTEPPPVYPPAQRHDERCTADGTLYTITADGLKVPRDIAFRPGATESIRGEHNILCSFYGIL